MAIHQANFCPWLPFFYKMAMVDEFILLNHVQFEKNGYQNRFMHKEKWITKPVNQGIESISDKTYVSGQNLVDLNTKWIKVIKDTLDIKTLVTNDNLYHETRPADKTYKLIDIMKSNARYMNKDNIVYVTNPEAKDKYLNEDAMREAGIIIEYCNVPRHLRISVFEAFEKFGIEGTINQLPRKLCRV